MVKCLRKKLNQTSKSLINHIRNTRFNW